MDPPAPSAAGAIALPEAAPHPQTVSPQAAARRALCLRALLRRGELEAGLRGLSTDANATGLMDPAGATARLQELNQWLVAEALWPAASENEQHAFQAPPGSWSCQALIRVTWRAEALGVVGWALGLEEEILPYDTPWSAAPLAHGLRILAPTQTFVDTARLRPAGELREAREFAQAWLWRARTGDPPAPPQPAALPTHLHSAQLLATAVAQWQKRGLFKAIQGDFPARGKAYCQLTEGERQELRHIATERLHALNWLCRYAANWDTVPTET